MPVITLILTKFNSIRFEEAYANFVPTIYCNNPSTQVLFQTSPMLGETEEDLLSKCPTRIADRFNKGDANRKPVNVFRYDPMIPTGCDDHPGFQDHLRLSFQLQSFTNKFINAPRS